jgi:hypothetical protein
VTFASETVKDGCSLAVQCSRRRRLQYALYKLFLSFKMVSPSLVDLDPSHAPRKFAVERDPLNSVVLATAVTLAYSAIEELQLEIRASTKNPALIRQCWNPKVKNELELRLEGAGISLLEDQVWTLRGTPTRVERGRKPLKATKSSWAKGSVRDVEIPIIDALRLASWLRSKITTHSFVETSRSLTVYDAHNVQFLARRLILESMRRWKGDNVT